MRGRPATMMEALPIIFALAIISCALSVRHRGADAFAPPIGGSGRGGGASPPLPFDPTTGQSSPPSTAYRGCFHGASHTASLAPLGMSSSSEGEDEEADDDDVDDLPPLFSEPAEAVFARLASSGGDDSDSDSDCSPLIGIDELERWTELRELIQDGEVLQGEVETIFEAVLLKKKSKSKSPSSSSSSAAAEGTPEEEENNEKKIDSEGFAILYRALEDLFEADDPDDDDADDDDAASSEGGVAAAASAVEADEENSGGGARDELLSLLAAIGGGDGAVDEFGVARLPCGLDCADSERARVASLVENLEGAGSNTVRTNGGVVQVRDLVGDWDLIYTSSNTMIINKGLSGLGRTSSDQARFGGLRQKLRGTKYLADFEYVERIEAGEESFDVTVTGEWQLKEGTDPITGGRSTVLRMDPERLAYGMSDNNADGWASLGPIKMMDVIYLDDGGDDGGRLLVCRGSMKLDSLFVFEKVVG